MDPMDHPAYGGHDDNHRKPRASVSDANTEGLRGSARGSISFPMDEPMPVAPWPYLDGEK